MTEGQKTSSGAQFGMYARNSANATSSFPSAFGEDVPSQVVQETLLQPGGDTIGRVCIKHPDVDASRVGASYRAHVRQAYLSKSLSRDICRLLGLMTLFAGIPTGFGPSTASKSDSSCECHPEAMMDFLSEKKLATRSVLWSNVESWVPP